MWPETQWRRRGTRRAPEASVARHEIISLPTHGHSKDGVILWVRRDTRDDGRNRD